MLSDWDRVALIGARYLRLVTARDFDLERLPAETFHP